MEKIYDFGELHDSVLYALLSLNHVVELYFTKTQHKKDVKIVLRGVKYMIVEDFREGNIVLDARIYPVKQLDNQTCLKLICNNIDKIEESKKSFQEMNVFEINCSYGCTLYILFDRIKLSSSCAGVRPGLLKTEKAP